MANYQLIVVNSGSTYVTIPQTPVEIVTSPQPVEVVQVTTAGPTGPSGSQGPSGSAGTIPNTGSFATTGSNNFIGNQTITGSIDVLGSITSSLLGTSSYALTASYITTAQTASYILNAVSASYIQNAESASYALIAASASNVTSASYALNSSFALNATVAVTAVNAASASLAVSSSTAVSASYASNALTASYYGGSVTSASYAASGNGVFSGSFSGSFIGDGSNLTGIVSSKWTGSNPITRESDVQITGSLSSSNDITALSFHSPNIHIGTNYIRGTSGGGLHLGYNGSGGGLYFYGNSGTTPHMYLSSSGNFGIGTTTPSKLLIIRGVDGSFSVENSSNSSTFNLSTNSQGGFINGTNNSGQEKFIIRSYASSGVQAYFTAGNIIVSGSNIGISTFTPTSKLHILTDNIGITQTTSSGIYLENSTTASNSLQQYSPSLIFRSNSWLSSTLVSQPLDYRIFASPISGTISPRGGLLLQQSLNNGSYTDVFQVGQLISNSSDYQIKLNGSNVFGLGGGFTQIYASSTGITFYNSVGTIELMRISSSGVIGLGIIPSGNYRLEVSGSINIINNATITGSLNVLGGITGSLLGTSSYATNALTASYATTASYVVSALTASYVNPLTQSVSISGSEDISGSLTIATISGSSPLYVKYPSGSRMYEISPLGIHTWGASGLSNFYEATSYGNPISTLTGAPSTAWRYNSTTAEPALNIGMFNFFIGANINATSSGLTNSTTTSSMFLTIKGGFRPTTGSSSYSEVELRGQISQSISASGKVRGLYVNMPVVSTGSDFRAIETSNNVGYALFTAGSASSQFGGKVIISGSGTDRLRIIGSGSSTALFTVIGSQGELFSITEGKVLITDGYSAGSGSLAGTTLDIAPTWNTSGTPTAIKLNVTNTASNSASKLLDLQVGGTSKYSIGLNGKQTFEYTYTAGGTTGAQTIDKVTGCVNFAAAATSLVVTNSTVTTNSLVFCTIMTNDATMTSVQVVPASGSFTIYPNVAPTVETKVGFFVIN